MEYSATIPLENLKYLLSYNYMAPQDAEKMQFSIGSTYKIQYDAVNTLTWPKVDVAIDKMRLFLINEASIDKIKTECEMLELNNGLIVEKYSYNLTEHNKAYGKYRVNVLIKSNDKLQYAIAYNEMSFEYATQSQSKGKSNIILIKKQRETGALLNELSGIND